MSETAPEEAPKRHLALPGLQITAEVGAWIKNDVRHGRASSAKKS